VDNPTPEKCPPLAHSLTTVLPRALSTPCQAENNLRVAAMVAADLKEKTAYGKWQNRFKPEGRNDIDVAFEIGFTAIHAAGFELF